MGGDVTAKSVPGEGSSFSFRMPLHAITPAPKPAVPLAGPADPALGGVGSLRVLVAEDHPVNRQYMAALLEGMGHRPFFAGNGLEAVQAIREQSFDIVLMDLHMPLLDGVGATLSIRALPDGVAATVPIIALTADAFAQTRERCLMAGMNDFLAKPVSPERLSAMFRRLFGGGASAEATPVGTGDIRSSDGTALVLDRATLDAALRAMPRERLAHLLHSFFEEGPEMVERLRVALRDGQALDLRVNAHAARGAALNFGLSALAQTAQALHEGATHVPAHEIARLIQRYEQLLATSREACEAAGLLEPVTG
jgi:CheY-like chemotaxis protein